MEASKIQGVSVEIKPTKSYPTPFGKKYIAKGFYIQGKNVIVVGEVKGDQENTIRIKYPSVDVKIKVVNL